MGIIDELSKALKPHTDRLNENLFLQGQIIHNKLHAIEQAVSDVNRGDIGDKWERIICKRKFTEGEKFELRLCPINEIFLIQAIAADGVTEKSPPFIIEANGQLIEPVLKEGIGFEGISGNQVVLPGETLSIIAREAGNIHCVITVIRKVYPGVKTTTDYGRSTNEVSRRNTHDIERDTILSRTELYQETPPETVGTEGRSG